jgi:anti-anti-sigma factor
VSLDSFLLAGQNDLNRPFGIGSWYIRRNPGRSVVMSLRVTTSNVKPDIVVLHLSGSMTTGPETDALESLFHELLDRRTTKLVFDLTGIDEIESGGTLFIVRCFFAARSARSELRFAAVRPEVLRPFKNAMLDTLLPFDATVSAACEHFSSRANRR